MKFFKATPDRLSVAITAGVIILFLGIAFIPSFLPVADTEAGRSAVVWVLVNLLNGSILLFCYLFHPLGYTLTPEELIIRRPVKSKVINLSDIKEIRNIPREDLKWSLRTFGNGGVFGYYGKFYTGKFGSMTWYASRRDQFVMIILKDGQKIVITPDDPGFTEKLSGPGLQIL